MLDPLVKPTTNNVLSIIVLLLLQHAPYHEIPN